jgi:6-phosphofructokinase 1
MSEDRALKDDDVFARGARTLERLELDALVVLGGDGSHRIAYELSKLGVRVVTIPKTIDNDLAETDLTFGFSSALDIAVEAVDRLHTTAESHGRVMVVEVMGRHAGWIALMAGLAGGADIILVPEIPFDLEKVAAKVRERVAGGSRFSIVVVAEGAKPAGGQEVYREVPAGADLGRLGGIGERVAAEITRRTGVESRAVVLGHVQRGGPPTPVDRILASCFGTTAVHAIAAGRSADTVVWKDGEFVVLPLEHVVHGSKAVPDDHALFKVARDLGITFAGEMD